MAIRYWLYCIGFLDLLALSIVNPLINIYFNEIGYGPSVIALYSASYGFVQLFSSPYIGHWSDTHGKIGILFICLIFSACGYGFSSMVLDFICFLGLARIFLGFFKHTQNLCRNTLAEVMNDGERTASISQYNSVTVIGVIVGSTASGFLSHFFQLKNAIIVGFLFCLFIFILNAVIVYFYIRPYTKSNVMENNHITNTFNTVSVNAIPNHSQNVPTPVSCFPKRQFLRKNSFVEHLNEINWKVHGGLFVTQFLMAFSVMIYRSSFILGVKHYYPHLSSIYLGYLLSYNAFIGFVVGYGCSFVFSHHFYVNSEEKLQLHAIIMISVAMLILATSNGIYALMIGLAVLVAGTVTSKACGVSVIIKRSDSNDIGKISGLSYSVVSLARCFAPIVAGFLQEYSYAAPACVSFFISLVALVVFYFKVYLFPVRSHVKFD